MCNLSRLPISEKLVDKVVSIWFEFGKHRNGNVDIANSIEDVFTDVPPDIATKLIDARDRFRAELYQILCKEV